ncbi:MAG: TonB family protein [Beijerinckiaceae bacterium]|nr:TonB family protein [Beijerinckiaceae bacterium]MCI0735770.1 TonB family protein [Beijerinckiaceae bacterium]
MRGDSESLCGRTQQGFTAKCRSRIELAALDLETTGRARWGVSAKIVLWSFLSHFCLVLAILFFDQAVIPPDGLREIAIELVMAGPRPKKSPAVPIENPARESPPIVSPDAKTGAAAHGGGRQDQEAEQRQTPECAAARPFGAGEDSVRATAMSLTAASGSEAISYQVVVGAMLERAKQYPEGARKRNAKGIATIGFVLDVSGGVASVSLLRTSGEADLDSEGLALVSRAAPYPPPPPGAKRSFAIEVAFGMGE